MFHMYIDLCHLGSVSLAIDLSAYKTITLTKILSFDQSLMGSCEFSAHPQLQSQPL